MLGTGEAIILYYALAAGLRAMLETYWLGSMLGPPGLERRRCRRRLDFGEFFASLMQRVGIYKSRGPTTGFFQFA